MSALTRLYYLDGRGRGEIVRLMLTACKIKFEETNIRTRKEFLSLRPSLLFGQLPLLKYEGESYVQSDSIVRSLGRKFNMCGKTDQEMYQVDSLYEGSRDFFGAFMAIGVLIGFEEGAEKSKSALERYLPVYDKVLLGAGDKKYLVGESLTVADLGLLEALLSVIDYHGEGALEGYKGVQKFLDHIKKEKFYDEYITKVRKPKNSPRYAAEVKDALAW